MYEHWFGAKQKIDTNFHIYRTQYEPGGGLLLLLLRKINIDQRKEKNKQKTIITISIDVHNDDMVLLYDRS